ncbi:MAG TPA: hypothetical protein DDZ39_08010 [Flavobacteriaceae bacterium]|jgi:hypothetical protein|nr:hypothetical protein [Flavobacteriaceae bacterium]HBS12977.1 hypothetical protein [Flavobacteriaceae bacterium]
MGINKNIMEDYTQEKRYLKAKEQVKKLKEFYIHLSVYIIINVGLLLLIYSGYDVKRNFWNYGSFFTPLGWGLGLAIHAIVVFGPNLAFIKHWENRKLNQFINEEKQNNNKQWE